MKNNSLYSHSDAVSMVVENGEVSEHHESVNDKGDFYSLWDIWKSDNSHACGELKEIAVARLKHSLEKQLEYVDLRDLHLTSLPDFSPNLKRVNAINNPLSDEQIKILQKQVNDSEYYGPEIIFTGMPVVSDGAISENDFRRHITLVFGFGKNTEGYMEGHFNGRFFAESLVNAAGIDEYTVKFEKLTVSDNMIKRLMQGREWVTEDIATQTMNSFINFLNENIERFDMHRLIERKAEKYPNKNYASVKNSDYSHPVDENNNDEKLMAAIKAGGFRMSDSYYLMKSYEMMLFRVTSKLTLDWAQQEKINVEFVMGDDDDWTKEQMFNLVEQQSKSEYKPITFSEISHIKRKNLDIVEFILN